MPLPGCVGVAMLVSVLTITNGALVRSEWFTASCAGMRCGGIGEMLDIVVVPVA
jgi:hypothetical protein